MGIHTGFVNGFLITSMLIISSWLCFAVSGVQLRVITIIIIFGISFMQGIHTYIPETNHVPREYCVAAIPVLLLMVLISLVPALTPLYLYVSTFRSMFTVPKVVVFCSSLTSCFPGMLLTLLLLPLCSLGSL
jgi:hypothetical protein